MVIYVHVGCRFVLNFDCFAVFVSIYMKVFVCRAMDSEMLSQCIGPLSKIYLSKCLHHVLPSTNLHKVLPRDHFNNTTSLSGPILKSFPFSSSAPVPLTSSSKLSREVKNGIDPTTVLIREKIKWQMKKDKIVKAVQKDKNNIREKLIKKAIKEPVGSDAVIPQGVALLAQHLDKDPDPFFSGTCNWYYTGGTLSKIKHRGSHFLLHADRSQLKCSRIVGGSQSELSSSLHFKDEGPIFQIITADANRAAVRQKSSVSLLSWEESEDNRLELRHDHSVFDNKHKFVSVALTPGSPRTFSTISSARILKLWDIDYKKCKTKVQLDPNQLWTTDNWCTLNHLDQRILLMADRCCLHILDTRAEIRQNELPWCPRKLTELCEEQCNMLPSCVNQNSVYVATTHQLLSLDVRQGYSQRWTHMMSSSPHLGFTHHLDDGLELVCLGSQVLSDCTTVLNSWKDSQGQSLYKPTSLISPAQGLHLARRQGHCLDPSFTPRCTQSMTGLTFLAADNGIRVVRQSATADIFVQALSKSSKVAKQLTDGDLGAYSRWSKPTLTLPPDTIVSTTVTSTHNFHSLFTDQSKNLLTEEPKVVKGKSSPCLYPSCQMSKQYMEDCVDLLAGKLLAVWQVEDEDEWLPELEVEESFLQQDPEEKVINWLQAADTINEDVLPSSNKPTVTSTPHALEANQEASPELFENQSEPSPWMTQPSQVLRSTLPDIGKDPDPYFSQGMMFSPPRSLSCSSSKPNKRPFENTTAVAPQKPLVPRTRPDSVPKKKFVPGF